MPIEVNRENYEAEVNGSDKPVLVDFWGPQCKPCLALMPSVEEIEKEYEGKLKVTKLNATENRMLCAKLRVMGLPTFLFYKNGTEVNRIKGEDITKDQIKEAVDELIKE
jgi:thioredoxin 1